jgi:pimeloyl-ACP methyl ester carboxylesterase
MFWWFNSAYVYNELYVNWANNLIEVQPMKKNTQTNSVNKKQIEPGFYDSRRKLVSVLPVTERRLVLSGVSTAILEGGEGSPLVLLHGPGESSLWWMRVIPDLVKTNRVIAPDLPGHGASVVNNAALNTATVLNWLGDLIEKTCHCPPVVAGHILGGSIAARFAVQYGDRLHRLVLIDSLGLGSFRPAPKFAFELIRFMMRPDEKTYTRFLGQCMYDADQLRTQMGEYWKPFLSYVLDCAEDPDKKAAMKILMKKIGVPKIPAHDLARIRIPVGLIWGRHDRANKLKIAESASKRYSWPLHIIEDARDDPKLEQPEAFVNALSLLIKENHVPETTGSKKHTPATH